MDREMSPDDRSFRWPRTSDNTCFLPESAVFSVQCAGVQERSSDNTGLSFHTLAPHEKASTFAAQPGQNLI